MSKDEGGDEQEYIDLIAEAITAIGKAQVYAKKLISQLELYGV